MAFACGTPKRLASFTQFQTDGTSLRPFCPIRWIFRKSSIISITSNYVAIMDWLHTISSDPDSRKHAAEASGFLEALSKFDTFLKLEILRIVFTIIEDSNTAGEFRKAEDTIKLLKTILLNARCDDRFQLFWEGALKSLEKYKQEEPVLPRKRKVPARHDGQGEHRFSANHEDHYRALYFQTLDDVIMGLTTRFEPTESSIHLSEVEKFIIGKCDVSYTKDFYKDDFEDYARLQLH